MDHYVVTKGHSAVVHGPLSEDDALTKAKEYASKYGGEALVVKLIATAAPLPREVTVTYPQVSA